MSQAGLYPAGNETVANPDPAARLVKRLSGANTPKTPNMDSDELWHLASHGIERRSGAAVIIDVVASVRRIERDEVGSIIGWVDTLRRITLDLLPGFNGRLVKSLGDGALIEFPTPLEAVHAALAIQKLSELPLRIGIEAGDYLSDVHDIYGKSVNRAARLMTLSEAGGITVSDKVRSAVSADLDAVIEDLGLHHLKHISEPVRAFRLGPPSAHNALSEVEEDGPVVPSLAVIPFAAAETDQIIHGVGDILCEEIIRGLSASPHLRIISRLSTMTFRDRQTDIPEISRRLNARFVLTGRYGQSHGEFRIDLELIDGRSGATVWRDARKAPLGDIYTGSLTLLDGVPEALNRAIINRETRRARHESVPNLENYTLLLAAISLTNSLVPADFELAGRLFEGLLERAGPNSMADSWRAYWFHMRTQQGWSTDPLSDSASARDHCKRALDADPESSLALAISGLIAQVMDRRLDEGIAFLDEAVRVNPNDPIAWLFRGSNRMFADDGAAAALSVRRARHLAPLDPAKFLYDCIGASVAFVQGDFAEAERLSLLSLRANRMHASTFRVRAVSLYKLGRTQEAQEATRDLLTIEPTLTVSGWLRRSPSGDNRVGRDFAESLRSLGLPE